MKPVLVFILKTCPYCKETQLWMDELKRDHPKYLNIQIDIIDERHHPDVANEYDYYYVPTFYVDGVKIHEGAATKDIVQGVFEKACE